VPSSAEKAALDSIFLAPLRRRATAAIDLPIRARVVA
jgi:hypothetical protein